MLIHGHYLRTSHNVGTLYAKTSLQNQGLCCYATRFTNCPERRSRQTKSKRCYKATVLAGDGIRTTLCTQWNIYVTQPKKTRQDTLTNGVYQHLNGVTHAPEQLNADSTHECMNCLFSIDSKTPTTEEVR
jgi:hypothetical protein